MNLVESHWQADFGMGYDFLRGAQINFGFRVAEIRSDITATTRFGLTQVDAFFPPANLTADASSVHIDRRAFLGAGPRLGLVGSVPLIGALFFDYSGNVAVLFGNTKFSTGQVLALNESSLSPASISQSGIVANQLTWTAPNVVYNYDVQAGFSYWFSPNWALKLSYRLDVFIDPLRVAPDDGVIRQDIGPGRSMDRYYHGPKAAVIAKF